MKLAKWPLRRCCRRCGKSVRIERVRLVTTPRGRKLWCFICRGGWLPQFAVKYRRLSR